MDPWVDILEVIRDSYVLNNQNLSSVLNSAKNCNRIVLISIIGQRNSGKTFFIKCLSNYLQCNNRENWPNVENAVIYMNDTEEDKRKYTTVRLSSQPIILKEEIGHQINEIAVFLMDTNFSHEKELILKLENILSLFLLTSSTVIYNQKFLLSKSDFSIIENLISRISSYDNSSNLIQKVWFVIRDWNPENTEYNLGFGAQNGKDYIKNLLKSSNLSFDKSNINCYLMPSPKNDIISSVEINLSKLNYRFTSDLKSITNQLLNTDFIEIKTKSNFEESININELIKLFIDFVEDMNNKSYTNTSQESIEYMNWVSNISDTKNSNQTNENKDNLNQNSGKCAVNEMSVTEVLTQKSETYKAIMKQCLKPVQEVDKCLTESVEKQTLKSINSEINVKNFSSTQRKTEENKQSSDDKYQTLSKLMITETESETLNDKKVEAVNSDDDYKRLSVSISSDEIHDFQNEDYIISDDDDYVIEANEADSMSELTNTSNSNLNDLSFSFEYNKSNELQISEMSTDELINEFEKLNLSENSLENYSYIIDMNRLDDNWEVASEDGYEVDLTYNPNSHRDIEEINVDINESTKQLQELQRLQLDSQSVRDTFETKLSKKVEQLFVDFKTNIKIKIKDQNFDLENGLQKAYKDVKQQILETFLEQIQNMPEQDIIQNLQCKHFNKLKEMIEQSFEVYENKVQQNLLNARNEYEKAMKKSILYFENELKSKIKAHIENDSYKYSLDPIYTKSKNKAMNNFSDETNKFYKGSIEDRYLDQLKKEMNQLKEKFDDIFNYLNQFESKWKKELKTHYYLSETKLKEFYEKEKQSLNNKMTRYDNSVLTEIAILLLHKSFKTFKEQNEVNKRHENDILLKAIDLALNLYKECLQKKLKSNLYLENDIKAMHNILFKHTLDSLLIACNFNEDQKDLRILCENTFKSKIGENYDKILAENQNLFLKITNLISNAKRDSLKTYCSEMTSRMSAKKYLKTNEFNNIHYKCSKLGFDNFNQMIEMITKDFDSELAQKLFLENQTEIRRNITEKKDYFKSINNKNTPKTSWISIYFGNQFMSAATYDKKINFILDKNSYSLRPNIIAFDERILCGFEAQEFYRTKCQFSDSLEYLNLMQFLGKDIKLLDKNVLSELPLEFCENNTNVKINLHDLKLELSIESLIALLLINVKSEAEDIYKSNMSNVVITYPSYYTYIQKTEVRNVAKIAGFDEIVLLSELSATAIGYCLDEKRRNISNALTILIIVINKYDCDIAVCDITYNKIQFKSHCYQNLMKSENNWLGLKQSWSNSKDNLKLNFDTLILKTLKSASIKPKDINQDIAEYIIAGDSPIINNLITWITLRFDDNKMFNCDPIKIISSGSALYSAMLSKSLNQIEISETSLYSLTYNRNKNSYIGRNEKLIAENTALPYVTSFDTNAPRDYELPLKITFFEGNNKSVTYVIQELPQPYKQNIKWAHMNYEFIIDNFSDIDMKLYLYNNNRDINYELTPILKDSELFENFIVEEQNKLDRLNNKLELIKQLKAEESNLEKTKLSLIDYCIELKKKFENNPEIRPLIEKQILKEIDETFNFLDTKFLDLKILNTQRQKLDNAIKILLN